MRNRTETHFRGLLCAFTLGSPFPCGQQRGGQRPPSALCSSLSATTATLGMKHIEIDGPRLALPLSGPQFPLWAGGDLHLPLCPHRDVAGRLSD